jgi:hypothetical protein
MTPHHIVETVLHEVAVMSSREDRGVTVEIGLADAIRALRLELAEAMADGSSSPAP